MSLPLPVHPLTGLRAVGIVGGRPVWPIRGGSGEGEPPAPQPPAPPANPPAPAPQPPDPGQLGDPGKAALDAERRARREAEKAAKAAQDALKAIEDKDKTALELAQGRAAELEKTLATEQAQRLRLQVATKHRIGTDDLVLLTGSTEEELEAQAARIAQLTATGAAATAPPQFAPSAGQQAGNGAPAPPAATVESGRALYQQRHPQKTS